MLEQIDQKYKVLKTLGEGHSGMVVLAEDDQGQKVAIKCLKNQDQSPATLKRFQREFGLLRTMIHPHIAASIDFGLDDATDQYYFVTEYVQGATLDKALEKASSQVALDYFAQSLKAVDYMHRQGMYHCDLKPDNILVTSQGQVKIIDFDVATKGKTVIGGTPTYFAPELLANRKAPPSARADLFSLGATFYRCVTGKRAYSANSIEELKQAHATHRPELPSKVKPDLTDIWDGLLMPLIDPNPLKRYASASAVWQQVNALLGGATDVIEKQDIDYRLLQHGLPIARQTILEAADHFLFTNFPFRRDKKTVWVLEAESGLGASFVLEELKVKAQLKGLECFEFNQNHQSFPNQFPFAWFIDDLTKIKNQHPKTYQHLIAGLKEALFKVDKKPYWIVMGGLDSIDNLPQEIVALVEKYINPSVLTKWDLSHVQTWAEDIFQTTDIPDFLITKLFQFSEGSPAKLTHLLKTYLNKDLLLNATGNWRKDLLHPTPLFEQEFVFDVEGDRYQNLNKQLNDFQIQILEVMALCYQAPSNELLNKFFDQETYSDLHYLVNNELLFEPTQEHFAIKDPHLKNFILKNLSPDKKQSIHDQLIPYTSAEEKNYHQAYGSNLDLALDGFRYFAEVYAKKALWHSAYEAYSDGLNLMSDDDDRRFEFLSQRAKFVAFMDGPSEALKQYQTLLKQFEHQLQLKPELAARLYERMGLIEKKRGHLKQARDYYNQAIAYLDPQDHLKQWLGLQNFVASVDLAEGHIDKAIEAFRLAYQKAEKDLDWSQRRNLTNNDLAFALVKKGLVDEALAHWQELLKDFEKRDDKTFLMRAHYQIAQTYLQQDKTEEAFSHLEQAYAACQDFPNIEMELRITNALANICREEDFETSLEMYERALSCAFQVDESLSAAVILINMGVLLSENNSFERAKHCLIQSTHYLAEQKDSEKKYAAYWQTVFSELIKLSQQLDQAKDVKKYEERLKVFL